MTDGAKISIIIIGYQGKQYLGECISSILDQETIYPYEIIFVDNYSNDGSYEFVTTEFPTVKAIRLESNVGYYEAFNLIASQYAQGDYLLPVPQDTVLHRKCLEELTRAADADNNVKICLVNTINPGSPDYIKRELTGDIEWVYLMSTCKFGVTLLKKWPYQPEPVPILAYSGVSALLKKDILAISGQYFDSSISHFLGDAELGIRVNVLGYKALLIPGAIIYHIEDNKSWVDLSLIKRAIYGARDTYLIYFKNMTGCEFLAFLPFLLIGSPLKVFTLRTSTLTKIILFPMACITSPFVMLWALTQLHKHKQARKFILAKRKNDPFWLFKTIVESKLH